MKLYEATKLLAIATQKRSKKLSNRALMSKRSYRPRGIASDRSRARSRVANDVRSQLNPRFGPSNLKDGPPVVPTRNDLSRDGELAASFVPKKGRFH